MKSIPVEVRKQISELAGVVEDSGELVLNAVNEFNDAVTIKLAPLDAARNAYNAAIGDLRGVYQDLADEAQAYFDERSERWQQGDAGTEYEVWLNTLTEAIDELPDLPEVHIEELGDPELFDGDSFAWPADEPG
jgi:hypothetical protein